MPDAAFAVSDLPPEQAEILSDFLYEAIYVPEGVPAPPREILLQPELQVYTEQFGTRFGDTACTAQADGKTVGAAWARIMHDYGHIDDSTPSLAVALYPEYRGKGIGTALLKALLCRLRRAGFARVSLSVQKENRAAGLYRRLGFETVREQDGELLMVCSLTNFADS